MFVIIILFDYYLELVNMKLSSAHFRNHKLLLEALVELFYIIHYSVFLFSLCSEGPFTLGLRVMLIS